jgi:GNAT superfamily N-acetyltransferase
MGLLTRVRDGWLAAYPINRSRGGTRWRHPGAVNILPLSPDDSAACAEVADLLNAVRLTDCPDQISHTAASYAAMLRHGGDGEPPTAYVGRDDDGGLVGVLSVDLPTRENTHLAWFGLDVHPEHRRLGYGSELLAFGRDVARQDGRRVLGVGGWDRPESRAFAARHGFEPKSVEICRRQVLADLDWDVLDKLYDEALEAADDYHLLRITDAVPDELLDAVVVMTSAINDAPTDDLDIDDDVYTPERIRAFETSMAGWDRTLYRVVARHNESGELGGHTLVGVEHERPEIGWQLDTAVVRAHRGHRLGLLVKVDLLRWLRDAEPQLASIDTWNAESNQHMIAVNEQMGYRVISRDIAYQRDL